MDQLFLMQRYWGSDEDNSSEESSFKVTPEKKLAIPLVEIHSDEDCMLPNKKQKLNSGVESNKIDSSVCDSDVEIVNEIEKSDSLENIDNKSSVDAVPFKLKPRKVKKQKLKDAEIKINDTAIASEKNDISSVTLNNDLSVGNVTFNKSNLSEINDVDAEIKSKKDKKRRLKHFEIDENNHKSLSIEHDQLNGTISNTSVSKDKLTKSPVQGKLKFNEEEISINDINASLLDHESEISSYKGKKQKLRYFDAEEIENESMSIEKDQPNKKVGSKFTSKGKIIESSVHGETDVNNKVISKNVKKLKHKLEEIDDNNLSSELEDNNMNSQDVRNAFPTIGQVYTKKDKIVKHTLSHWFSNTTYISVNLQEKEIPISELSYLDRNTKNNLIQSEINFLFPVQLAVIPWLMQSKEQSLLIRPSDICVSAPTGSGKTLAFVLPIVQSLKDCVVRAIRALVVLPVSELAFQVYKVFQTYIKGTDLKVALLTGKKSFTAEQNFLVKSTSRSILSLVDIVVATPGRIHDHIYRTQGFCLKRLRYLVIDEADRMMEEIQQGWLKQVEDAVLRNDCLSSNCVCSSYKRTFVEPTSAYNFGFISQPLQKLLYSATLTHDPEQLHTLSLYKPKLFTASSVSSEELYKGSCAVPSGLEMLQVICEEGVKPMVICHLIKHHNFKRVLCFTETVERAHRLHLVLEEMGLVKVREISSFNRTVQRKIVLNQFKSGKIDILVCSDLVARGIDIENIDCVISYDIPQHVKLYIHRIGRTARAGKTGTAIALLSEGETTHFKKMLEAAEIKLPEKNYITSKDLEPLIKPFQDALSVADAKLRKEKNQIPGKLSKKTKRK